MSHFPDYEENSVFAPPLVSRRQKMSDFYFGSISYRMYSKGKFHPNLNLSRTAIIRTYSKEIVSKAQFNSVRFSE